ncbi:MAG TPA: hypothetical protein VNC78_08260 [Actinomycetota bacterium]|nr:hypothetical protein [Actinomycetota bacterium]
MKEKRSRSSRIAEFLLWAAVAVGTAVLLVQLSDRFLPANF